jgi:hypothetical protein
MSCNSRSLVVIFQWLTEREAAQLLTGGKHLMFAERLASWEQHRSAGFSAQLTSKISG